MGFSVTLHCSDCLSKDTHFTDEKLRSTVKAISSHFITVGCVEVLQHAGCCLQHLCQLIDSL